MNRAIAVFLLYLSIATGVNAQSLRGAIGGSVSDSSGRAVAGARVEVVSLETNRRRETVTTPAGDFLVSLLAPGRYRISIAKDSFVEYRRELGIEVNQQVDLGVVLTPAGQRETVEVRAVSPLVRSETAALGGVITTQQILDLPLDGRNYYELSLLLPGVTPSAPGSAGSVRGDFAIHVNGAREDANLFLLDGVYNGDPKLNGAGLTSPVDGIREFEVATANYDASFGRNAGAQVNVATKSGANAMRGSAWWFARNAALDARNFFAPAGEADPRYQRQQAGAAAGGALRKDKTFWFADYEYRRLREGLPRVTNVPGARERTGDFTQSPGVLYVIDPFTQGPFPGNVIPAARQSAVGRAIAGLYPLPNRAAPGRNYASAPVLKDDGRTGDIRFDHSLGARSELSARYSVSDRNLFEPFAGPGFAQVPGYGNVVPRRSHNFMASETRTFTPALLNETRMAWSRSGQDVRQQNAGRNVNKEVGLAAPWTNPRQDGLSFISVLGYSPLGDEYNNPQQGSSDTWQIVDNVIWVRGASHVKFGGEARKLKQDAFRDVQARGLINFVGFTGNALSELLQGLPAVSAYAKLDNPQRLRAESYGLFGQWNRRVTRNLNVNAGLRYELTSPPVDPENRANVYDAATGSLVQAGSGGMPRAGYRGDGNNLAPRVGLAWAPGGGAAVVRAGYGLYFDQSSLAPGEGLYFNAPYFDFRFFYSMAEAPLTLYDPFPSNRPGLLPPSGFGFNRDLRSPYVQHWSLTVQQPLGASRVVEIGYAGSKGTHLWSARDINQAAPSAAPFNPRPNLRFGDVNQIDARANSNYHSLQATFRQRWHGGLSALASYTCGKSIDDASGFFPSGGDPNFPQDSRNVRLERARSGFDARQRLSLSYSWMIPGGKNARAWRWLVSGWLTNGIWTMQTGRPFTVALPGELDNSGTGRSSLGFGANDRPNLLRSPRLAEPAAERWFDPAAFVMPAYGTFGTAGRNIVEGPGLAAVNLSLLKNFALREGTTVQVRAEAFNALNRTNFNLPQNFLGGAGFGAVTSAQNARVMQLGVKLLF